MDAKTRCYFTYPTPHGPLTITASEQGISSIAFDDAPDEGRYAATALANRAANQMQEYLAGKRQSFDVPLDVAATPFQQMVWDAVCAVPYGATASAADIARAIGKPSAHRSIGVALRQNPVAPIIPTHRILAPNQVGKTARIFQALRALEAAHHRQR